MSIRKSILFGIVLLNEVIKEFRDPGGFVSFSYENLYGFVPETYQKKNVYGIVHKLKEEGGFESTSSGIFKLTSKGKNRTDKIFPLLRFMNKSWDGKWRIVGFDIEEKNKVLRDVFRISLQRFGFGMFQKSLYVSALPIENEIQKFLSLHDEILPNVYVFVSDKFFLEDKEAFVERVFGLSKLNEGYKKLMGEIKEGLNEEQKRSISREFLEISLRDPFLPKELLPSDFARIEVWKALESKNIFNFGK